MKNLSRRAFLKSSVASAAALTGITPAFADAEGAEDQPL